MALVNNTADEFIPNSGPEPKRNEAEIAEGKSPRTQYPIQQGDARQTTSSCPSPRTRKPTLFAPRHRPHAHLPDPRAV